MLKNWKTTAYGICMLVTVAVKYFFPEHAEFAQEVLNTLIAVGFIIVVKDHDVTGGSR